MSKRKSTNSVLSFHDVLNDINNWQRKIANTMKLVIILMDCAVKKKFILTQVRGAERKNSNLKNLKIM